MPAGVSRVSSDSTRSWVRRARPAALVIRRIMNCHHDALIGIVLGVWPQVLGVTPLIARGRSDRARESDARGRVGRAWFRPGRLCHRGEGRFWFVMARAAQATPQAV